VANVEKKMPRSYITRDGFGITAAARDYLSPLIQGEAYPAYRNGLPAYVRLRNESVPRRLRKRVGAARGTGLRADTSPTKVAQIFPGAGATIRAVFSWTRPCMAGFFCTPAPRLSLCTATRSSTAGVVTPGTASTPIGKGHGRRTVQVYVEMLPTDVVKYELDKNSGFLVVDRPQRTTSSPPALYGFIPRTYCAEEVAKRCPGVTEADGDPLDICVYSERHINRSDIVLNARVVGGIQMIDGGEADDKIVAVLDGDNIWGDVEDISDLARRSRPSASSTTSQPTS
jgi:inorganic pyrophosphatase